MREHFSPPANLSENEALRLYVLIKLSRKSAYEHFLREGGSVSLVGGLGNIHQINSQVMSLIHTIKEGIYRDYKHEMPILHLNEESFLEFSDCRDSDYLDLDSSPKELLRKTKICFLRGLGAIKFSTQNQKDRFKRHLLNFLITRVERKRCSFLTWVYPPNELLDSDFLADLKYMLTVNKVVKISEL
jgi:hypothetical protein